MSCKLNYDRLINDSIFINEWKNEIKELFQQMHPEWDKDDMDDILNDILRDTLKVPEVILDNNYTHESRDTNMISVFDWSLETKPLVAGNGTFYKNQYEAINPIAEMLDGFLKDRKRIKKEMFKLEDQTSDLYKDKDREQLNKKRLANSYYGGSGMPKSAFYSKWSGPATTGTAQSVISTTETFFEGYLVDNYKFIDINECFHYMYLILNQDYELQKWIMRVNEDDLFDRLVGMFYDDVYTDEYENILRVFIHSLSEDEITKIFYKNNFIEFTRRHNKVLNMYDDLFSSVKNYEYVESSDEIPDEFKYKFTGNEHDIVKNYNNFVNNQFFMDPNSPPDTIIDILKKLDKIYMTYVYIPFMSVDRIYRLKYFPRKTVCIVDTDSNIMALDQWVNYCENEVMKVIMEEVKKIIVSSSLIQWHILLLLPYRIH